MKLLKKYLKESYQKYPYLNYTFLMVKANIWIYKSKTCILTENGYQEMADDFRNIGIRTQDDIDIVCAFHPQEKLDEMLENSKTNPPKICRYSCNIMLFI